MPHIDYMKLLHIAAVTLETSTQIDLHTLDINYYNARLTRDDGSKIEIQLRVFDFEIELTLSNKIMNEKELLKWLPKFEYQLEQNYFKNIALTHSETNNEYKIKIVF